MPSDPHSRLHATGDLLRLVQPPRAIDVSHRDLLGGEFWQRIPAYRDVDAATFEDHHWQSKHAITRTDKLFGTLRELMSDAFYKSVDEGLARSSMSLRLTPYIVSLIDWEHAEHDPIRKQFLPLSTEQLPDHPRTYFDALHERAHSPVEGLTHRYADKVLFITQDRCPVYCRYCTRSYAVGLDTEKVDKAHVNSRSDRWDLVFEYLRAHSEVEDVVISGGDTFQLRADQIRLIGDTLLDIPHIRRMRFATKGVAVLPMKLLTDHDWFDALAAVAQRGRKLHKDVVVHTHFSHPSECTEITQRTTNRLFEAGITVRNQCVLLRGVNDDAAVMRLLIRRLGYLNIQPYYVFQHDMVRGVEDLRTPLRSTMEIEKSTRGHTAGFNTPMFVIDTPGGGGKRDVHSYEHYNQTTGISVFRSPNMDPTARYVHFDPIDALPEEGQSLWADPSVHEALIADALAKS